MRGLRTPGGVSEAGGGRLPPPSSRWPSPLSPEAELCTPTAVSLSPRASGGGRDSLPDSVRVHTPQRCGREAEGEDQQGGGERKTGWGRLTRSAGGGKERLRGRERWRRRQIQRQEDRGGERSLAQTGSPVGGRLFHRSSGLCPEAQGGAALSLQPHSTWGHQRQDTQTSGLTGAESWLRLVLTLGCACWACR